jgi:outer membrane protein OmpA-like peptidoglycan-associated protein
VNRQRAVLPLLAVLVATAGTAGASPGSTPADELPRFGVPVGSSEQGEGAVEDLDGPVEELDGPVLDIVGSVSSLDGALQDVGEGSTFVLAADVYFAFDSADLQPRAATDLATVAEQVRTAGTTTLEVTGHTDSVGTPAYNLDLSQRRAESVRAALTPLLPGVDVTAVGVGETQPAAAESGEGVDVAAAQAANRRVEITTGG